MNVVLAGEQGFAQANLPIFLVFSVSYGLYGTRAYGLNPLRTWSQVKGEASTIQTGNLYLMRKF